MADDIKTTMIEDGTAFDGAIQSLGPVRVSGDMQGKLEAPEVTVTDSGAVRGEIQVGTLESNGELGGRIEAEVVRLAGRVKDDTVIEAKTLCVEAGSGDELPVTFGTCELRIGGNRKGGGAKKASSRAEVVDGSQVEQRDAAPELEEEPAL